MADAGAPEQDEEDGCTDEGRDGADRDLDRCRSDARQSVGDEQQQCSRDAAHDQDGSGAGPDDDPHRVRDDESDEGDDADRGDTGSNEQDDGGEGPHAYPAHIDAHSGRVAIAEGEHVEGADDARGHQQAEHHEWCDGGHDLRAKVATMTLATFHAAAAGNLIDTTIWARFVQPSALIWQADDVAASEVRAAIAGAATTAARLAVALGPAQGTAADYWRALFRATYAAEFRVEKAGRENSILEANPAHFAGLLPLALEAAAIRFEQLGDELRPALPPGERNRIRRWWAKRRRLGKPYNLVRLVRASTTFEGAARYAAWKIERHTGIAVPLTPWRERHPVLAAPAVLWQVWRARRQSK